MSKEKFINKLKERFEIYHSFYSHIDFNQVLKSLSDKDIDVLICLEENGEVGFVREKDGYYEFFDISFQTPKRLSCCYDYEARVNRKKFPPESSVEEEIQKMGVELLEIEDYQYLQSIREVDTKTSSWVKTPREIRDLGGALFMEKRYNQVFVFHNGADSYYSSRGFRCKYRVKVSS